jgi:ribosomal-protein-alanine N-acetyltransferase
MTLRVRRMRWWDLPAVAEIERRAFPDDAWSLETFWSELAERGTRVYLVAEGRDGLLGYTGIAGLAGEADLQTIAVDPAARGRGLGRRLLDAITAEAAATGARRMHLEVRADNEPAIALYSSGGYRETGRRRGYYPTSDGPRVDALLMSRRLDG